MGIASLIIGASIFVSSCSVLFTSFEINFLRFVNVSIYEYDPPFIDAATPQETIFQVKSCSKAVAVLIVELRKECLCYF